MKKLIITIVIFASFAWGIEITGVVGLNFQTWNDGSGHTGSGAGLHGGILGGIGITPSCLPVYVGLESGFLLQNANYTWPDFVFSGTDLNWHYNNLVIPILLKGTFEPSKSFRIGAGMGPSIIRNLSGSWDYDLGGVRFEGDFEGDDLETDIGWLLKGDVGIKLIPTLWLKPSLAVQFNLTADDPDTENQTESETAVFLGIGLAINI